MSKKETAATETNDATETKAPAVDIIRGRMPLAMVFIMRFQEEGTDSEIAAKYRTTPGKVNDIKKNRNFGYIDADAKFTAEDITAAKERAEQLGDAAEDVIAKLDALTPATEAEAAALAEKRKSERKPRGKKAEAGETDAPAEEADHSEADAEAEADLEGLLD